ncbi:MAG: hypothetical protein N2445_04195, partial [Acidobacteria bacterium]|nr:hypothetical protein [Acidobacteriota bacterium]
MERVKDFKQRLGCNGKSKFVLLALLIVCVFTFGAFAGSTGADDLRTTLWTGKVFTEEQLGAVGFPQDTPLPPLVVRVIGETPTLIEASLGGDDSFYPVYLKDGIGRLPFAVPDVKALEKLVFRTSSKANLRVEVENSLLILTEAKNQALILKAVNWSEESDLILTINDSWGNPVSVVFEDDTAPYIADSLYLGRFFLGDTASVLIKTNDAEINYPLTATLSNDSGEIAETTIYNPEAGSYLCATPGKDGAGGTLTGTVNTYYPLTASANSGAQSISVGTSSGASTQISAGDLLLIVQMQDAEGDYSNTDAYGDGVSGGFGSGYTNLNNSGKYEFVKALSSVNAGSVSILGAGTGGGLINSYAVSPSTSSRGRRSAQVVRVPQYSTATLSSTLTCLAWNGSVGGILALDVSGTLTLGGTVSVDGMGFRGGTGRQLAGGSANALDYRILSTINAFGLKGEGISGTPAVMPNSNAGTGLQGYPNGDAGRGAPGNAGGGGNDSNPAANDENAGAGGGSYAGSGGRGGNTWNDNLPYGGHPGGTITPSANRIFLGAGGGAGGRNNTGPSDGGAGGGIVIIRANAISGTGTITANGAAAPTTANDGGGGGGAGGTIIVYSVSGGPLTGLTVSAN